VSGRPQLTLTRCSGREDVSSRPDVKLASVHSTRWLGTLCGIGQSDVSEAVSRRTLLSAESAHARPETSGANSTPWLPEPSISRLAKPTSRVCGDTGRHDDRVRKTQRRANASLKENVSLQKTKAARTGRPLQKLETRTATSISACS
jgi:hypothetical protein